MQLNRWFERLKPQHAVRRSERARVSVTVPGKDAERLRCALFRELEDRIERLVSVPGVELGTYEPIAVLHIVLDCDATDEALHIVMTTADRAQLGRVARLAPRMAGRPRGGSRPMQQPAAGSLR
jgi:hypothetical protein